MLKSRLATAIFLILTVIWVIFSQHTWIPYAFVSVLVAFMGAAVWEWTGLMSTWEKPLSCWARVTYVLLVLLLASCWVYDSFLNTKIDGMINTYFILLCVNMLVFVGATVAIITYPKSVSYWNHRWFIMGYGIVFLTTVTIVLLVLRYSPHCGAPYIMSLLLMTWAVDTGAYFAGRFWGNKKFLPAISPNKTWAGLWGGLFLGSIIIVITGFWFGAAHMGWIYWCVTGIFTLLGAVMGDLLVSMLKRVASIKDTGTILPGHGGVLDRVDSLLVSSVTMAFFLFLRHFF